MDDKTKTEVLLHLYSWFTSQIQHYLTILWRIATATAGIAFIVLGWFMTSPPKNHETGSKIAFTLGMLIVFGLIYYYARKVEYSFQDRTRVVKRLDDALRLFEPDVYIKGTIFPEHYQRDGEWKEPLFRATYSLIAGLFLLCLVVVWL